MEGTEAPQAYSFTIYIWFWVLYHQLVGSQTCLWVTKHLCNYVSVCHAPSLFYTWIDLETNNWHPSVPQCLRNSAVNQDT